MDVNAGYNFVLPAGPEHHTIQMIPQCELEYGNHEFLRLLQR